MLWLQNSPNDFRPRLQFKLRQMMLTYFYFTSKMTKNSLQNSDISLQDYYVASSPDNQTQWISNTQRTLSFNDLKATSMV